MEREAPPLSPLSPPLPLTLPGTSLALVPYVDSDSDLNPRASTSSSSDSEQSLQPGWSVEEPQRASGREARKQAEKQRRTVLNSLVQEIAHLLPLVQESTRKVDKTGVLRLAAHEIRKEHVFGDSVQTPFDFGYEAAEAFLDLFDGFFLTLTTRGIIVVASPNIHQYLGHAQVDLLGNSVHNIVHREDECALSSNLAPGDILERRDFVVRLARAGARQETPKYAVCRFRGAFRAADHAGQFPAGERVPARRQRMRRERMTDPSGNDIVLVCLVHVLRRPPITARLLEASKEEYWTRHLVDGRIVHCDQRISLVAGYMSEEVTGVSAFQFMHREDVRWVVIALRQMYDQNQPYGESCYRLASRTGQFMYLRTRGYLEIDHSTKAAQSFVCINSLISDEDGYKMITDMKKRYSAIINMTEADAALYHDDQNESSLENPRELEHVIMCLIDNLPSVENSPQRSPASNHDVLTIIPPEANTVKISIQKSLSIVSASALKRSASTSSQNPRKRPNVSLDNNHN